MYFFINHNNYYEHNVIRKYSLQISKLATVEVLATECMMEKTKT